MSDRWTVLFAVAMALSAALAPPVPPVVGALVALAALVVRRPAVLLVGLAIVVGGRAHDALTGIAAPLPASVDATAELVSDPERSVFGTQALVSVDGRRYVAEVPIDLARPLDAMLMGERLQVVGRTRSLHDAPRGWVRSRHLAGRLQVSDVSPVGDTSPWFGVANAVHRTISAGAAGIGDRRRSLYLGLVLGDDRGQDDLTTTRFQAAGLTHLLAVSGQNVAFLLAVFAPLMQRLGMRPRIAVGLTLLVLFTLVTRAEPSVLRAGCMAAFALVAVNLGRLVTGLRILAFSVVVLLLADPLMVHSVGFQLSVCATAGLLTLTRPIGAALAGPQWLIVPLSVTLAAQIATAPLILWLNGSIPSVAVLANLLAVPAAGLVMMLGLTVGLVAGTIRDPVAGWLQMPNDLLVWWVDVVAAHASRSSLPLLDGRRLVLLAVAGTAVATGASLRRRSGAERTHRGVSGGWSVQRWRGSGRLPVTMMGVAIVVAVATLVVPSSPAAGRHSPVDGVVVLVGTCGGVVATVDSVTNRRQMLAGVASLGIRRIDVLVVGETTSAQSAASLLAQQLEIRRTARRDAEPVPQVTVGGARIVGGGAEDPVELLQGPCSLAQ